MPVHWKIGNRLEPTSLYGLMPYRGRFGVSDRYRWLSIPIMYYCSGAYYTTKSPHCILYAPVQQGRITEHRRYDDPNVWNVEEQVIMTVGGFIEMWQRCLAVLSMLARYLSI